jgi:hypothetical protein
MRKSLWIAAWFSFALFPSVTQRAMIAEEVTATRTRVKLAVIPHLPRHDGQRTAYVDEGTQEVVESQRNRMGEHVSERLAEDTYTINREARPICVCPGRTTDLGGDRGRGGAGTHDPQSGGQ